VSFVAPQFFLFLAAAFACYFAAPPRLRWCVLLAASYVFYWFVGGLLAMCAISFTILTVHACGLWAGRLREARAGRALRRAPLAVCLALNFGLLLFLKFSGVFLPGLGVLLIPGISFYTFQAAGYLIDIYKGKAAPWKNPFRTALFVSFFPQLIQGPISRHSQIADDLFAGRGWDWERARGGLQRVIWGYFMKLVIADHAAPLVNKLFADYHSYGGAVIVFGMLVYSVQIYADFAGGINVALGIGEILGVNMPENFRQPFFANSLTDFWRRWHITLTAWLRDYLFYPIALSRPLGRLGKAARAAFGNRVGKLLPTSLATFAVYFAMGVWHGSGANLFVFGILNGLFITAGLFAEPQLIRLRAKTGIYGDKNGFGRAFAVLRTLALMVFLRYFAGAPSLHAALSMLKQTLLHPRIHELWSGALLNFGLTGADYAILAAGTAALLARDVIAERGADSRALLNAARPAAQFALLFAALVSITLFGIYSGSALSAGFIYAQY